MRSNAIVQVVLKTERSKQQGIRDKYGFGVAIILDCDIND